jgi:hypothetical protein
VAASEIIRDYLTAAELPADEPAPGSFVVQLPGERKLRTTVSFRVGGHSVSVNAFVARHPDENHAQVYRWLLEQNSRMGAAAYSVDHLGDIYLTARIPLDSLSEAALDRVLGTILEHADGDFNTILELGFRSSIEKEWRWRLSRGEPTENLAAFAHLAPADVPTPSEGDPRSG